MRMSDYKVPGTGAVSIDCEAHGAQTGPAAQGGVRGTLLRLRGRVCTAISKALPWSSWMEAPNYPENQYEIIFLIVKMMQIRFSGLLSKFERGQNNMDKSSDIYFSIYVSIPTA